MKYRFYREKNKGNSWEIYKNKKTARMPSIKRITWSKKVEKIPLFSFKLYYEKLSLGWSHKMVYKMWSSWSSLERL